MDRNKLILAGLGVIFLVTLTYRLLNPFEQPTVAQLTNKGQRAVQPMSDEAPSSSDAGDRIRLAADSYLKAQPVTAGEIQRNPFGTPTVPDAPAPPPAEPIQAQPEGPEDTARNTLKAFKVFGSFAHGDEEVLFLERKKQIILIRRGDLIDGIYRVEDFSEDSLTVTADSLTSPILIRLEDIAETPTDRPRLARTEKRPTYQEPDNQLSETEEETAFEEPDAFETDDAEETEREEGLIPPEPPTTDSPDEAPTGILEPRPKGTGLRPSFPVQREVD